VNMLQYASENLANDYGAGEATVGGTVEDVLQKRRSLLLA